VESRKTSRQAGKAKPGKKPRMGPFVQRKGGQVDLK